MSWTPLQYKSVNLTLQDAQPDGCFRGYASLFDLPDQEGDIVRPTAFKTSLQKRPAGKVRMLYQHDPMQPLGVWLSLQEDKKGLLASGRIIQETQLGREVMALMTAGALDGLSIGYRILRAASPPKGSGRLLQEIDLWEISLVTFPMNPNARIEQQSGHNAITNTASQFQQAADFLKSF